MQFRLTLCMICQHIQAHPPSMSAVQIGCSEQPNHLATSATNTHGNDSEIYHSYAGRPSRESLAGGLKDPECISLHPLTLLDIIDRSDT